MDKSDPLKPIELVLKRSENHLYSVEDGGDYFYALSNHNDAKNFKIMQFKGSDFGDISKWEVVLDERESHYIEDMLTFNEHIVIQSRFDGIPLIEILNIESKKMSQIKMTDEVYDVSLAYNNNFNERFFRYSYSSLKTSPQIYKYDLFESKNDVIWKKQVNNFFDSNYDVKRIKTSARDKTEVPVSIVYKKGLDLQNSPMLV